MTQHPDAERGWRRHKLEVDNTVVVAAGELAKIVQANPNATIDQIAALFQAVANKYRSITIASAFRALENSRDVYDRWDLPDPEMPDNIAFEQARASTGWALWNAEQRTYDAGWQHLPALIGSLGRAVRGGSRDAIFRSTRRAKTRWARVPGMKACWFCLMLASRGAVYETRETALIDSSSGDRFHDHCDCLVVESYTDYDLPAINRQLHDEWHDKVGAKTHYWEHPEQQREAWRAHVKASRPMGYATREVLEDRTAVIYPTSKSTVIDGGEIWAHIRFNPANPRSGGHIDRDVIEKLAPLVAEGLELDNVKHFAPEQVLLEASAPEVVGRALDSPDVVKRTSFGYQYTKTIELPSGRYRLICYVAPGKGRIPQKVTSVFVDRGARVGRLEIDGRITWEEDLV